ncbi:hypothetical protein J45TS6_37020 [Paenibacillus sp. J45TS6]|uniref:hypothetical protein n=1 Tax=unclassified Paenibacillus TaxID=185978 RepID=UPI001B15E8F5|nr:hypothetical protein [Paenibacillus sp. J45TS6]GIP45243.1 hypothetical protein J45TS6_37020 [Paenibacillus sp. J45TS6]
MIFNKPVRVSDNKENDARLTQMVFMMTVMAWVALITGVVICLFNLHALTNSNTGIMVGIGFLVGSVYIYFIGKAMGLLNIRRNERDTD